MSSVQKKGKYLSYSTSNPRPKVAIGRTMMSGSETDVSTSNENLSHEDRFVLKHTARQEPQGQEHMTDQEDPYSTLIIHEDAWSQRIHDGVPPPMYKAPGKETLYEPSVKEITAIPDDYLSQSQVLKHLAKEVKVSSGDISGESSSSQGGKHSSRKLNRSKLSKSQPDLTLLSLTDRENTLLRHTLGNTRKDQQRCAQMVDHLLQENSSLKSELESCYHKVAKAHKLEEEVSKVTRAHEELVATCERRERLESARISRLQAEVRRLQETNQRLVSSQLASPDHSQLAKREALIAQLLQQNKELVAAKERQEIELAAQRATLQEQRTHIDILDTALINAQANVVRLEEECRQKQRESERVGQLQRALQSLQLASDRREQTERKLRLQLEQELKNERAKNSNPQANQGDAGECLPELKRQLREKDEKIMRLEGEVAKWEQKYLEESQLRQAAIEAASIPKDAKIAALERTSQETEKLIAEARSDRIRQMDEVHAAQKKVTDLEAKVKELECKLAEKDAMIRVLQNKHTLDKEVSSSYTSISLSHHTPHPSLNPSDLNVLTTDDLGGVSTTSVFSSSVSSALTSSTGFSSEAPTYSTDSYHTKYSTPSQSYHHKSLDDQLKELDSQLLSKRGLCCFPGLSHPGSSSRKGKLPQPLLASVAGNFESGGILQGLVGGGSVNRSDDIVLLEKQGLCSQQQRQPERCAPSSLPRPKRNRSNSKTSKVGEYGRLSDSETTKASNNSSGDANESRRGESPTCVLPLAARKLAELGRLSDSEPDDRKLDARQTRSSAGSPLHRAPYTRLTEDSVSDKKMSANSSADSSMEPVKPGGSPGRAPAPPRAYTRLSEDDAIARNFCRYSDDPGVSRTRSKESSPSGLAGPRAYGRLSEGDAPPSLRESPARLVLPLPPRKPDYTRLSDPGSEPPRRPLPEARARTPTMDKPLGPNEIRMSPINKFPQYRYDDMLRKTPEPDPLSSFTNSKLPTRTTFLPPPRKLSDFGCFDPSSSSKEPKLRLLPSSARRGSLHTEPPPSHPKPAVRSLPASNKYRIQF